MGQVSLPSTDWAPGNSLSLTLVPTKVALFRDHTCSLHHVVLVARLAGAKVLMLGWFSQLWGLGGRVQSIPSSGVLEGELDRLVVG